MGGTTAIRNLWQTIKTFTINKILQKLNSYLPEWNCKGGKVILDPRPLNYRLAKDMIYGKQS